MTLVVVLINARNKGKDEGGIILTKGELYHIVEALELHKWFFIEQLHMAVEDDYEQMQPIEGK